jgi:acetolactate synthase-1/2/3 large subunit
MEVTDKIRIPKNIIGTTQPDEPARRTAEVMIDILLEHGVQVVFGIPGGAIAPIYDALLDRKQIRVITSKHETSAMFAAAGYARTTGKLAVVLVTSGPGVLNAMTGLASAYCDGIPVLLLAGEVSRKVMGKGALQEGSAYHLDVIGMAKRISKVAVQINEPNAAPSMLRRAISTALSGRKGPAMVTLPIDVASALIVEPDVSTGAATTFVIQPWAISRAADSLMKAHRPLIFAGAGMRHGDAPARLIEVAERLQCPVMTTPKGKGVFPEDHPLSLGVFGIGGHPSAIEYLKDGIDALMAVGTSLGELSTNGWSGLLTPKGEFIHVDIDANQLGRAYASNLSIAAPAEAFLTSMRDRIPQTRRIGRHGVGYYESFAQIAEMGDRTQPITPQRALWEIQQVLPRDTIFTCDVGEHSVFATHYLRTSHPDSFILLNGLGSMGQGIGTAIGAQLARPDRTVATICGDGCFAMTATEVATAVQDQLPIIVFVLNDERLGMVELGLTALYGRTATYPNSMDISKVAEGMGAQTLVVEHPCEILEADFGAMRAKGPVVVDVRIDKNARMPKHGRFEALGNIVSRKN